MTTAIELATTVAACVAMAAEVDPQWLRECARDAWKVSGLAGIDYTYMLGECRENIELTKRMTPHPEVIADLARETVSRHGLDRLN